MAKIRLTKNELKLQKDALKRFNRYLPTLVLKKQQLQVEILKVQGAEAERRARIEAELAELEAWIGLLGEDVGLEAMLQDLKLQLAVGNIAGIDIPVFRSLEIVEAPYDLFTTPLWVDRALEAVGRIVRLEAEIVVLEEQRRRLAHELRVTSQRVNLFEKVKIPESERSDPAHPDLSRRPADRGCRARQDLQGQAGGGPSMIVPMKKVTLVALDRHRAATLRELRRAGVMHVQVEPGAGSGAEEVERLREQRATVGRAHSLLTLEKTGGGVAAGGEPMEVARAVVAAFEREQAGFEQVAQLRRLESALEPWGDFSPADIRELAERGITLRLATMSRAEAASLEQAPESARRVVALVGEEGGLQRVAVAALGADQAPLPGAELPLAERGLADVRRQIARLEAETAAARQQRLDAAGSAAALAEMLASLDREIEFERIRLGMGTEGPLVHLTGFVPQESVERLEQRAASGGWALLVEDPLDDDPVPTLVRNPAWIRIVQPLFDFLGITPGYGEHDISLWFLLFYAIFWAMIVGDAGYGLVYLGITVWLRSRMRTARPEFFRLVFVMSTATIIWGALTGTWFGSSALADLPPLRAITINAIASFPRGDVDTNTNVMLICFVIAGVHLSLAHILAFFKKFPGLAALSDAGWILVLWGMFFVVQVMVLGWPGGEPALPWGPLAGVSRMNLAALLVLAGLVIVVPFQEQQGKVVKGVLMGIAWLPMRLMNAISAFADTVSYVRLFAVGLAGVKVAEVFNTMAGAVSEKFLPAGVLIIVVGHALNLVLGSMALLVHGVRLKVLEFSSHLGMEWKGTAYTPFAEHR